MDLEAGHLYHIYNQGNNRRKIFYTEDNYIYFLLKIRQHVLPFCNILAYCLMPNHFHLMVEVNDLVLDFPSSKRPMSLNRSVGIMLASYTRAINKFNNQSGSLFRCKTKAICLTPSDGITPSYYNSQWGAISYPQLVNNNYPQVCFNYMHQNPVAARLVKSATDWTFSSARDFAGLRKGTLVDKEAAIKYLDTSI